MSSVNPPPSYYSNTGAPMSEPEMPTCLCCSVNVGLQIVFILGIVGNILAIASGQYVSIAPLLIQLYCIVAIAQKSIKQVTIGKTLIIASNILSWIVMVIVVLTARENIQTSNGVTIGAGQTIAGLAVLIVIQACILWIYVDRMNAYIKYLNKIQEFTTGQVQQSQNGLSKV